MSVLKSLKEKTTQDMNGIQFFARRASRRNKVKWIPEWISPLDLILKQTVERYDLIIRDLAIGEILGENSIGLNLWDKLSYRTRIPYKRRLVRLKSLIDSFQEHNGFLVQGYIPVDEFYQLWGGAHRIVLAKRWNILEIPIAKKMGFNCRKNRGNRGCFNTKILEKCGYTKEEIDFIKESHDEYIKT